MREIVWQNTSITLTFDWWIATEATKNIRISHSLWPSDAIELVTMLVKGATGMKRGGKFAVLYTLKGKYSVMTLPGNEIPHAYIHKREWCR